jgi:3-methyladenine DNA glycosylase AlkC
MAEPLKNQYGPEIPRKIAEMISNVHPQFPAQQFLKETLDGYESLELMPRGRWIADSLRNHLPRDFKKAVSILVNSMGPKHDRTTDFGITPFLYMPHSFFVAKFGLDDFEASMRAQYEITQRFTAEFSIRPFLIHFPEKTLAHLRKWTRDPSPHVRRLVSEGTRPRLPWAPRLPGFQKDPRPVLKLLELLKNDPDLYVRRSVANNLNDIGKDNPSILINTARNWLKNASPERTWIVNHALRFAIKKGVPGAIEVLGFQKGASVSIGKTCIQPSTPRIGDSVLIGFEIKNQGAKRDRILVDFQIHFQKANGKSSPKVFKMKTVELPPQGEVMLKKKISLVEMTTRKHYPGRHQVDAILNGVVKRIGLFELKR